MSGGRGRGLAQALAEAEKTEVRWHCIVRHFVCFLLQENSEMANCFCFYLAETHSGQLRYTKNEEKEKKKEEKEVKKKLQSRTGPVSNSSPAMTAARTLRRISYSPEFDTGVPHCLCLFFFFLFLLFFLFPPF